MMRHDLSLAVGPSNSKELQKLRTYLGITAELTMGAAALVLAKNPEEAVAIFLAENIVASVAWLGIKSKKRSRSKRFV